MSRAGISAAAGAGEMDAAFNDAGRCEAAGLRPDAVSRLWRAWQAQREQIKEQVRNAQMKFTELQWDIQAEIEALTTLLEDLLGPGLFHQRGGRLRHGDHRDKLS